MTAHRIPIPFGEMLLGRPVHWILPCGTQFHTIQSDPSDELGEAYTVKNDNITREEFFYEGIF